MAAKTIKGTGVIAAADYNDVSWTGKTKDGRAVTITLNDAINLGNIDWTFAEKDDVVPQIVFTATYDNTNETADETEEPWTITIADGGTTAAGSILLGTGIFSIGGNAVALCRGGGQFTVEREFREINADGDRGPVSGRIVMEGSRATLTMNVLSMLSNIGDLYAGISVTT